MVQFNFSERTIKAKVVYYGPAQSGKTTNLEQIHRITDPEGTNRLISLNTAQDRTLFFDLLPFSLGTVSGYDFKVQLYTVPGQVQYNATRRVVLAGADAVVFVADSQKSSSRENQAAFENMKVNLLANRLVPEKVPLVLQYNKQDLADLVPRAELERLLNPWRRKSYPAVAARGQGVMETFVAVVQDMLGTIAVKYNLKEKGLDPDSVSGIVAQAFADLLKGASAPPPVDTVPPPPKVPLSPAARVVVAQPEGVEPAYPGPSGPEANPVSEELLHRAIRSNVDLAEALGQVVREVNLGLARILVSTAAAASPANEAARRSALGAIERETQRLHQAVQEIGQKASGRPAAVGGRAPAPPQVPPTPPRGTTVSPPAPRPAPPPTPAPPPPVPVAPRAVASPPPTPSAALSLDGLLAEVVFALRAPLAARPVVVQSRIARGATLPRCSPVGLRRALAALVQGLAVVVVPGSAIAVRAETKPVLLRGRDGGEVRRDFVMLALTHTGGLSEPDQQRVLKGADTGPLGEAHRQVREMGGFLRFAPLPGGALETRAFLPA